MSKIMKEIAERHGVTEEEITKLYQDLIDATWEAGLREAPEKQAKLFPGGKPTPEELHLMCSQLESYDN